MNKCLTAAVLTAILPFSMQISAQAAAADRNMPEQVHKDTVMTVARTEDRHVVPVNLDAASASYDLVLPQQPVHMTADRLVFRGSDDYAAARGNVDIMQGMDELHANMVEGNTKSQVYHTSGKAIYLNSTTALTGTGITYNGGASQGAVMDTIEGFIGPAAYIRGSNAEMYDGAGYVQHGLITTPHAVAKVPDYYITGDDIHIYPGQYFTAENTKLWFKNICLFTYGHYRGRLDTQEEKPWAFALLPRPSYDSDNGVGLHGDARFPVHGRDDLFLDVSYAVYTKEGFKPGLKIGKKTGAGTFTFGYSKEESTDNDDHIWATRWPELRYFMPRLDLGRSGIYVDADASWGRWSEGSKKGVHKGVRTEISHQPLPLWNRANLRFYIGYRKDWYSYHDNIRKDPYWGAVLNQGITDRLWTTFWYKKHNLSGYTPYRFDTISNPRQKGFSVGYVLTPLDTIMFTLNKDLDNGDIDDRNFTWIRDLHSFIAAITYKQVDKEWDFQIVAKDLDF